MNSAGRRLGRRIKVCAAMLAVICGLISSDVLGETVESVISQRSDDAEEAADGAVSRSSTDLEMVYDRGGDQIVGMRFTNLDIPQGATITDAWIQFTVDESTSVYTSLILQGLTGDVSTFGKSRGDISSRERTAASVNWEPPRWRKSDGAGPAQRTPDLSAIVQELVDQPGWQAGSSSIGIVVTGTGERVAVSYNGNKAKAPRLHVEYTDNGGGDVNEAPVVDAGPSLSIFLPDDQVFLDATVSDDGLPENGRLEVVWSHVGGTGAGTVIFDDSNAVDTTASFSPDPGSYILRLTATDGALTTQDETTVQVYGDGAISAIQSISQVNYFDTGYDDQGNPLTVASTDPAGIVYDSSTGHLLIADSEITEIPEVWENEPYNIFETDLVASQFLGKYDITSAPDGTPKNREATGIAYCASDGHYYVSNDDSDMVYRYAFSSGSGFVLTDSVSTHGKTSDPEGITCDSATGRLFVAGGDAINIVVYRYGNNGFTFDRVIDLAATAGSAEGIPSNPEGIAYDDVSGHLFVLSNDDDAIFEYADDGSFLAKFNIRGFSPRPRQPQGLTIGPSSGNPASQSFYISDARDDNDYDPNERDGRIYEAEIQRP